MPVKIRKSRSINNSNRTISKQSRKQKTPKGKGKSNANVKSKSGKRSRRRVKRGGADGANQCEGITLKSLTEKNMIGSMEDKFIFEKQHEFLNLKELRKLIQECKINHDKSIKDSLIALIKNRGYYDEQITKLLNYTEKNFEDYKNKTRNRFNYLMVGAIAQAIGDPYRNDNLPGWSLNNKDSRLEALINEPTPEKVNDLTADFIKRGLELLFTESDDDITCEIDKTTKFPHAHFDVMYKGKIHRYTNLKIYRHAPKKEEIHEGRQLETREGNQILRLNDDERKKRKEQIKKILSEVLNKLIFGDMKPIDMKNKEEYKTNIDLYHTELAVFTGKLFKEFCADPERKLGNYETSSITLRTYTSLITDIYLKENGITKGE